MLLVLFDLMNRTIPLCLFFLLFIISNCNAQKENEPGKKFIILGTSAVAYKGSLSSAYVRWTPAFHFGVQFQRKRLLNGRVLFSLGQFIGEGRDYALPVGSSENLVPVNRFKTNFISLAYELQVLLFEYKSLRITASQGIGLFRYIPRDWDDNILSERDRTRNLGESYGSITLSFPTQFGVTYLFPNQMGISFQAGWYNTISNYLDNMSELANNNQGDNVAFFRFNYLYPLK